MDMKTFEEDAVKALSKIPQKFTEDIARVLMSHDLSDIFPKIMDGVGHHIRAIVFEAATGMLDKDELEQTLRRVVGRLGVNLPEAPAPKAA